MNRVFSEPLATYTLKCSRMCTFVRVFVITWKRIRYEAFTCLLPASPSESRRSSLVGIWSFSRVWTVDGRYSSFLYIEDNVISFWDIFLQGLREFVISFSISFTKTILSRGSETFVLKFQRIKSDIVLFLDFHFLCLKVWDWFTNNYCQISKQI